MPTRGSMVFLCTLALLVVGVVMVNSAGMTVTPVPDGVAGLGAVSPAARLDTMSIVTSRSSVYLALAIGAFAFCAVLPVRRLAGLVTPPVHAPAGYLYAVLIGGTLLTLGMLALVYIPSIQREVNYSARWIAIPVVGSVQPSEFAKWGMIPLLAWYAAAMGPRLRSFLWGLLPAVAVVAAVAGFIVLEDLGTGVLVASALCVLLVAAGARIWHFLLFVPPAALGVFVAISGSPYRVQRILSFLDPFADPRGSGYHMIQSMSTVAGGGLAGRGLGHGIQKFGYLPEDTTDFLFAVICEETGLAGAAGIIAIYLVLAWALAGVVRHQPVPVLRYFVVGVLATMMTQAIINLVVVTGLGPTKGIALPLLSSGGTGWVLTAASLGLVCAIDRAGRLDAAERPDLAASAQIEAKPARARTRRSRDPLPA
jgi:cell division protein FtsW